jgi:hypothetical protein
MPVGPGPAPYPNVSGGVGEFDTMKAPPPIGIQEVISQGHDLLNRAEAERVMLREEIKQRDLMIQELVKHIASMTNG